jgi:hypothetical protein
MADRAQAVSPSGRDSIRSARREGRITPQERAMPQAAEKIAAFGIFIFVFRREPL